jgi:hypothetical protein
VNVYKRQRTRSESQSERLFGEELQLVQALRDRERLHRIDVHGQRSRELERVERIPARGLVDAEERWSREDAVEPLGETTCSAPTVKGPT